jgi:hypothetical protein
VSAVDVLVKMILRYGDDPANYSRSRVTWAVNRIAANERRQLEGRSQYRQQGEIEYRRCLLRRQQRLSEEMAERLEGGDIVRVLRDRLISTFSLAEKAGMKDLMHQVGLSFVEPFELPPRQVSLRTRQWRIHQAKNAAAAKLASVLS